MIIVSQDKSEIINFEHISGITISEDGHIGVTDNWGFDTFVDIGTYKTEERAKEVLKDLVQKISSQKYLLKSKAKMNQRTIKAAKRYFENLNKIELIISDSNFDIIPVRKK